MSKLPNRPAFELYVFADQEGRVCVRTSQEDCVLGPVRLSAHAAYEFLSAVSVVREEVMAHEMNRKAP